MRTLQYSKMNKSKSQTVLQFMQKSDKNCKKKSSPTITDSGAECTFRCVLPCSIKLANPEVQGILVQPPDIHTARYKLIISPLLQLNQQISRIVETNLRYKVCIEILTIATKQSSLLVQYDFERLGLSNDGRTCDDCPSSMISLKVFTLTSTPSGKGGIRPL